ncbi:hypothetical protein RGUI_2029 [Rhodovulum sp. P5]|uniref:PRC-barrel domain-containing protein n=1 Tax=Rhodovulum sp. P5 TaxID=1564506 RepID=UPI0009C24DE9|nr:PRC-barrel domain-containing protein [Rhodovulum sp. P5]ARE40170.1 hypothetical protein RGUI_2029 [Rhodovulum sp. P5]
MKLMTATVTALTLAATGALAENTGAGMKTGSSMEVGQTSGAMQQADGLIRTRDITGGKIYTTADTTEGGWNPAGMFDKVHDDWKVIGEIEDVVLSHDGQMIGVVGEVGGFLDIADKHVMISVSDLNLVAVDDMKYALVTRLTEEQLEQKQNVDEGFWN